MIKKKKQVILFVDRNDLRKEFANSLVKNIRRDKFEFEVRQAFHKAHMIVFIDHDGLETILKHS